MKNAPIHASGAAGTAHIFIVRGTRVILDSDLAELYGVPTKRLNEQLRRNPDRFPPDFAFRLSRDEWQALRSQIATSKVRRGQHRRLPPYAFTEVGALMAAGRLRSRQAVAVSIDLIRTLIAMSKGEWPCPR